jgi:hypothetical protein
VRKTEIGKASGQLVPRVCTLDGFAQQIDHDGGVDLTALEPLTCLRVQTRNTEYKITVLSPSESKVIIQGGRFAVEPTAAELSGSSFGGNFLKVKWIGVNMRMEFHIADRCIVTSPVRSAEIDSNLPGPF